MNILEEFWYGNIEPAEYDISPSKEYKELLQLISRNEDILLATMTDAQKELFTKYADCVREYQVMAECLLFQNSFRLGAKMRLELVLELVAHIGVMEIWGKAYIFRKYVLFGIHAMIQYSLLFKKRMLPGKAASSYLLCGNTVLFIRERKQTTKCQLAYFLSIDV